MRHGGLIPQSLRALPLKIAVPVGVFYEAGVLVDSCLRNLIT
jgi:hypothetical protein